MEPTNATQTRKFPDGFLWGASTASYQVEGGIENVDWAKASREGKVPPCGVACDHYNRYEQDFDLIVELNQNAHRFSIEWARIEPSEGKFNEEEIEHYRKVIQALKRRNITPYINLWHFTLPLWFSESGGFFRKDGPEIFARYCAYVVEKLGGESDYWLTLNEPEIWSYKGHREGTWPPFKKNIFLFCKAMKVLVRAHRAAYKKMKHVHPGAKIGIAKNNTNYDASGNLLFKPLEWFLKFAANRWFLNKIVGYQDFIGLNHYFHTPLGWKQSPEAKWSDMGWELHPDSLYTCLMELKRYDVPIYVTENGIADRTDRYRAEFIQGYVGAIHRAIQNGVDVKGYFYWSLLDNYEWAEGFTQRFGLVEIEYATMQRSIRPSARVYAAICQHNAL